MALFIFDLDGTLLQHSTDQPLPGVVAMLKKLKAEGHQIVFTTRRSDEEWGPDHPKYSVAATKSALDNLGIEHDGILYGLHSPRIVVNDEGAEGHVHPANTPWEPQEIDAMSRLARKIPKNGN